MKERPILFSAPMVRAILDDKKTQTRRIVKPLPLRLNRETNSMEIDEEAMADGRIMRLNRFGQPGDRLWVRETWQHANTPRGPYEPGCTCFYRADYWDDPHGMDGEKSPEGKYRTWIPSIHMLRTASRINLEVVHVRVERLQAINHVDCIAEGAPGGHGSIPGYPYATTPHEHYRHIWESINGAGSWEKNPWVWVVEFKRIDPPKNEPLKIPTNDPNHDQQEAPAADRPALLHHDLRA